MFHDLNTVPSSTAIFFRVWSQGGMPKHKIYGVLRVSVVANHKTLSNREGILPWRVRAYFSDIAMGIQTGQFNFL